jgi:hypothetical protein
MSGRWRKNHAFCLVDLERKICNFYRNFLTVIDTVLGLVKSLQASYENAKYDKRNSLTWIPGVDEKIMHFDRLTSKGKSAIFTVIS